MIPIGYMAKYIEAKTDWLRTDQVVEIVSVQSCFSKDFADWIHFWRHNGYWFFDSPEVIIALASDHGLDLSTVRWFYYEAYEKEFNDVEEVWQAFEPQESFETKVVPPIEIPVCLDTTLCSLRWPGGSSAECSLLSCNRLAEKIRVNRDCLLETFEEAMSLIDGKGLSRH